MPDPLRVTERIVIPEAEISYEFSRSGGPGGQSVNTTDSRVRLRWAFATSNAIVPSVKDRIRKASPSLLTDDGDLLITCDVHRSQHMNAEEARERLVALVRANLHAPKARRPTKPTKAAKKRRVDEKKRRSGVKKSRGRPDDD